MNETALPDKLVLPDGGHCPDCGSSLERVHRDAIDRWVSLFRSVHRYRCTDPACGWEGLLGREDVAAPRPGRAAIWAGRLLWFVVGAAAALGGVQGWRAYERSKAHANPVIWGPGGASAQARAAPAGKDFPGVPLPSADERVVRNRSPLNLRRSCAWGVPGGNPYRGTVEQALLAAQLPLDVVRQISEMAERGWIHDQVEISRAGIRTVNGRRDFGTSMRAMGFGNTLCFDTRVNFPAGHVEYANYYEAQDSQGRTYSVMVPYVCQNVAVLGERAEEEENGKHVAEPATWSTVALGLGLVGWVRWRGRRGSRSA